MLGTPTEEDWPGCTRLPGYKPHKLANYKSKRLGLCWPRLHDVVHGEQMAAALLQLDPAKRIGADEAMHHRSVMFYVRCRRVVLIDIFFVDRYFDGLPRKLLELPEGLF